MMTIIRLNMCRMMIGAILAAVISTMATRAHAASDLKLAPNLSFTDDSSPNFPIEGRNLGDATITRGVPTVVFFGTSNCWNTAREAERLVALYPQYSDRVHFVVVDLKHASPAQKTLISRYYHGYIPTLAIFDKSGDVVDDRAGETASKRNDTEQLKELIDSVLR
jgi:hypothetical protein